MGFLTLRKVQVRHVEHETGTTALVVDSLNLDPGIAVRSRPGLPGHLNELADLVPDGAGLVLHVTHLHLAQGHKVHDDSGDPFI